MRARTRPRTWRASARLRSGRCTWTCGQAMSSTSTCALSRSGWARSRSASSWSATIAASETLSSRASRATLTSSSCPSTGHRRRPASSATSCGMARWCPAPASHAACRCATPPRCRSRSSGTRRRCRRRAPRAAPTTAAPCSAAAAVAAAAAARAAPLAWTRQAVHRRGSVASRAAASMRRSAPCPAARHLATWTWWTWGWTPASARSGWSRRRACWARARPWRLK
mmetsp:Transcript_8081/g.24368  ORF Transcript_8081/g.24368 Transcript_8081/m.24368 type:complete len:226 (+) Transcript_8081:1502-2179(+)